MTHRILLTSAVVTMLAASTAMAQNPSKSSTTQQPKPTVQQPRSSTGTKSVHMTKRTRKVEPKKVELKEAQPGLISQATYSLDNALATAQKTYSGTVVSERIEKRGDQLVYVFGIRNHQKLHHVMIDAKTGSVVKPQAHARKQVPAKTGK